MYGTAVNSHAAASNGVDNERVLSLYGIILGSIPALGIFFFWTIGAIGLLTNDAGLILDLRLSGLWLTPFWALPFVVFGSILGAIALFALRRHKEAVALAGLPVIATIAYYFALVQLR